MSFLKMIIEVLMTKSVVNLLSNLCEVQSRERILLEYLLIEISLNGALSIAPSIENNPNSLQT